jgi:hypothetical protein
MKMKFVAKMYVRGTADGSLRGLAGRVEEVTEGPTLVMVRWDDGHLGACDPEDIELDTRYAQPEVQS